MSQPNRVLLCISLFSILIALLYYMILFNKIDKNPLIISKKSSYRGCIITLIRSDNPVSFNKLMNMLNSLTLYFINIHLYSIYLFHESTLTNDMKTHILHCTSKLNIKFYEIYFNVTIQSNRSGYASMCQFWSYDLWFKYNYLQNQCDYVMRFDDDSYLINSTGHDLFEDFHKNQYDYGYRIIYNDNNGLDFIRDNLRLFLPANQTQRGCIQSLCIFLNGPQGYDGLAVYNNFFLMRLNLMYQYPIIERYLKQLISLNAFYRYRIGDANIQTICLLLIANSLKIAFLKFPYNHNVHGSSDIHPSFIFYENTAFMWYFTMKTPNITCKKLFIATKYMLIEKNL